MTEDLKKPNDVPGQQLLPLIGNVLDLDSQNQKLREENEALRELLDNEGVRVRVLEKQIRDLKATLSESAANGGTWPV